MYHMNSKLSVVLFFIILFCSCKKEEEKVNIISIGYDDQIRYGDIILAVDSPTLVKVLDTAKAFQKYKRMVSIPETSIVSEDALQYLSIFVNENCNHEIDKVKMRTDVYFTVRTFANNRIQWCYYYIDDDNMLNYFERMLQHINKKPEYHGDFENLIANLETFISNGKKIKKYGKENWKNH